MNDERYWSTARRILTPKQLRVLELREQHGFSLRQVALACDLSVATVRGYLERSRQKIDIALAKEAR